MISGIRRSFAQSPPPITFLGNGVFYKVCVRVSSGGAGRGKHRVFVHLFASTADRGAAFGDFIHPLTGSSSHSGFLLLFISLVLIDLLRYRKRD